MSSTNFFYSICTKTSSSYQHSQSHYHLKPSPNYRKWVETHQRKNGKNPFLVKSFEVNEGVDQFLSPTPLHTNDQEKVDVEEESVESSIFEEDFEDPVAFSSSEEEDFEEEDSRFKLRNGREVIPLSSSLFLFHSFVTYVFI